MENGGGSERYNGENRTLNREKNSAKHKGVVTMPDSAIHIISHTDLDGAVSAALAWHAHFPERRPVIVSLTGYGDVDNLIMECLSKDRDFVVTDLYCQRRQTVDALDARFAGDEPPRVFDHHKSTLERWGERPWAVVDTSFCAAKVYHRWLVEGGRLGKSALHRVLAMDDLVEIANDRDLWIGKRPEGRLWQALVTLSGHWSVFSRLAADPSPRLHPAELDAAGNFVARQEERFTNALRSVRREGKDLLFADPGLLDFGDVSDFAGLVLDRMEDPPRLVAVCNRKFAGDWSVSLRSRGGLAGRVSGLLKDGERIRGGGHGDAAALSFPPHYNPEQVRTSLLSAVRTADEQSRGTGLTLGDLLSDAMKGEG